MYKVMIAENELLVRIGLAAAVHWEERGLELAACVEDGEKALEVFGSLHPDILLIDTELPRKSGAELLRIIRETDQRVRCIFITAEEDWSLLHSALDLGVSGCLLRSKMTEADLLSALDSAVSLLSAFDRASASPESPDIPAASPDLMNAAAILNARICGPDLSEQRVHTAAAAILEKLISLGLWNVYLPRQDSSSGFDLRFALSTPDSAPAFDVLYTVLSDTLAHLRRESGLEISMVYCTDPVPENVRAFADRARLLLSDEYFSRGMLLYLSGNMTPVSSRVTAFLDKLRSDPSYTGWRIGRRKERLFARIQEIEAGFAVSSRRAFDSAVYDFCLEIVGPDGLFPDPDLSESLLSSIRSSASALQTLYLIKNAYFPTLTLHPVYGDALRGTILYIQQNLHIPLTLPSLARRMNLSSNYYAALFKNAVGLSVTEYIANLRLDLACDLLFESELTIQEISVRCGFTDVTYFSRFFKNHTGLPPQKWRMKHRNGTEK